MDRDVPTEVGGLIRVGIGSHVRVISFWENVNSWLRSTFGYFNMGDMGKKVKG